MRTILITLLSALSSLTYAQVRSTVFDTKSQDYTIFHDGEVHFNSRKVMQDLLPTLRRIMQRHHYQKPTPKQFEQCLHRYFNKTIGSPDIVVLDPSLIPCTAVKSLGIVYTESLSEDYDITPEITPKKENILYHFNQYLFHSDTASFEWLKTHNSTGLFILIQDFGAYKDPDLLQFFATKYPNNLSSVIFEDMYAFAEFKGKRYTLRKELILAFDKQLGRSPKWLAALKKATQNVQEHPDNYNTPQEIIAFLSSSSRGYYVQDPDGHTNLREGKSTQTKILQKIPTGQALNILDDTDSWYLVRTTTGTKGYVHKSRIVIK